MILTLHLIRWIDYGCGILVDYRADGSHERGEWCPVYSDGYNYWRSQPKQITYED